MANITKEKLLKSIKSAKLDGTLPDKYKSDKPVVVTANSADKGGTKKLGKKK